MSVQLNRAVPVVVAGGTNKFDDHNLLEKSVAPVAATDKVLAMLGGPSKWMNRMDVSQKEQVDKHQKSLTELSLFGSVLVIGAGRILQALERTPLPKKSPNLSPATYFRSRRLNQADIGGTPADHAAEDFNMGSVPGHVHHSQYMNVGYYPGVDMMNRLYVHS